MSPSRSATFLELDELHALIDAAAAQDAPATPAKVAATGGDTRHEGRAGSRRGISQGEIAAELGLAKATVNYHARRLGSRRPVAYAGRAFVARVLGYSGVRNSELCDLRIRARAPPRPGRARFHIPDAKTETGIRVVEMSPDLAEAFVEHLDRLRRAGQPTGARRLRRPEHPRRAASAASASPQIVREAASAPTETRRDARAAAAAERRRRTALRRTYISIALLANRFDVKWVMSQVGHADSKMTLDVYAQLEQRVKRDHGSASTRVEPPLHVPAGSLDGAQLHGTAITDIAPDENATGRRSVGRRPRDVASPSGAVDVARWTSLTLDDLRRRRRRVGRPRTFSSSGRRGSPERVESSVMSTTFVAVAGARFWR